MGRMLRLVDCFDMVLFILMLIIARLRPTRRFFVRVRRRPRLLFVRLRPDPSELKPANSNPVPTRRGAPGHFSQPFLQEAHEAAMEVGVVVAFLQEVVVVGV